MCCFASPRNTKITEQNVWPQYLFIKKVIGSLIDGYGCMNLKQTFSYFNINNRCYLDFSYLNHQNSCRQLQFHSPICLQLKDIYHFPSSYYFMNHCHWIFTKSVAPLVFLIWAFWFFSGKFFLFANEIQCCSKKKINQK